MDRHIPVAPIPAPALVRRLSRTSEPVAVWVKSAGGVTFRDGDRFLKWRPGRTTELEGERDRLIWARRWHSVPEVLDFEGDDAGQVLVTAALPGESAVSDSWVGRPRQAVRAIARGLRELHDDLPVDECPFGWSVESRLARVAPIDLPTPPIDRLVVCHGDACSPNTIVLPDGTPSGQVDLRDLGVADRWADLAVATLSLGWCFDPPFLDEFWDAYGLAPDPERLDFYTALYEADELEPSV